MKFQKIQVKRELLADWLTALRSGKYKQGKHKLAGRMISGEVGYCCLGVKCQIQDPKEFQRYYEAFIDGVTPEVSFYTSYYSDITEFSKFLKIKLSEDNIERLLASLNDGGQIAYNFINKHHLTQWCIDKKVKPLPNGFWQFSFQNIADFIEEVLVEYID